MICTSNSGEQKLPGIGGGGDDHVPQAVTEFDPAAEQGREQVGALERGPEVLLRGVAVIDHLFPGQAGGQRRCGRIRQDGVDVNRLNGGRGTVGDGNAGGLQHGPLVKNGLSHAAAAHQGQGAGV